MQLPHGGPISIHCATNCSNCSAGSDGCRRGENILLSVLRPPFTPAVGLNRLGNAPLGAATDTIYISENGLHQRERRPMSWPSPISGARLPPTR
jgi:hypothetical protein